VLFGAAGGVRDSRKGFDLLISALQRLSQEVRAQLFLLIFGSALPSELLELQIRARSLGSINDDELLSVAYSAADVFVAPSRQENLSLAVLEALSCGTPVLAFRIGGMPDMIRDRANGWLVEPFDVDCLAARLLEATTLSDDARLKFRMSAGDTIQKQYSEHHEATAMQALYSDVCHRG
jgi:glycosyltransferase involved in cell wall biosynthesis